MALLGHTARFVIHCESPETSVDMWEALGFETLVQTPGYVRLTDGQITVSLLKDHPQALACAYFAPSLQRVGDMLRAASVPVEGSMTQHWKVGSESTFVWWVHSMHTDDIDEKSGEASPFLGYFDAVVVPVADANTLRSFAEQMQRMGYVILEDGRPNEEFVDVTDGLVTISARVGLTGSPLLNYSADIDAEWYSDLERAVPGRCTAYTMNDDEITLVKIQMPDHVTIMITQDM